MKEREKLILTAEEARNIVYEDTNEYDVISDDIVSTSRWSEHHDIIVKRVSDGKFFESNYSTGKTEMQDESPYEYDDPEFTEVFPVEETVIKYK